MPPILDQQRRLLAEKLRILNRLQDGLSWSLERLPTSKNINVDDPALSERIAAINDRFCKLQDQLAGSLRHAHDMLGEKQRSFHDVLRWAISEQILADEPTWLELRSLRNRLTHEYDLTDDNHSLSELTTLIRQAQTTLMQAISTFEALCRHRQLIQ